MKQVFKLMVEHEGYPYIEMDDLSLEDANKEEAHYKKLFPENNYWIEESQGTPEPKPFRITPHGAVDGWEDLFPDRD